MKARVVTQISIAANRTEVFSYLTDLQYHELWNPHIRRLFPLIKLTLGTHYQTTSQMFGVTIQSQNYVTKLVKNRELEIQNDTGSLQYTIWYRLRADGTGSTLLICNTTVSSESKSFAFARPILKLLAQQELKVDLQLLKAAVEQQLN
jgi:hypothetical protein